MKSSTRYVLAFAAGSALALALSASIERLDALAFPHSAQFELQHQRIAAASLHLLLRHVPVVVAALLSGLAFFKFVRPPSFKLALVAALPWLLYVIGVTAYEGALSGENSLLWLFQAPYYVALPNLVSVPLGLWLAFLATGSAKPGRHAL